MDGTLRQIGENQSFMYENTVENVLYFSQKPLLLSFILKNFEAFKKT